MFSEGAVDEVKKFCLIKINRELSSNKIIGIEEIKNYLNGKITLNKAKELIDKFVLVCESFCSKKKEIQEKMEKLTPENAKNNN